ncbi:hypothetical protein TNCT_421661 [Trichonephila clavata]|uniref:Uncharacterized protein n=1 Tax=Trichonephila clavata TaxID=2740835 RepID=A0A8X6EYT7_TRICU|nr:hypothetical protein TNCT_421661 [Trichonephila clavata]
MQVKHQQQEKKVAIIIFRTTKSRKATSPRCLQNIQAISLKQDGCHFQKGKYSRKLFLDRQRITGKKKLSKG